MKPLRLLLCCLLIAPCSFGQFGMPSFEEVARRFYSTYSFNDYQSRLRFYRKKDGWYVSEDRYDNMGQFFHTELFWSKEKSAYQPLQHTLLVSADTAYISGQVSAYLKQIDFDHEEYDFQRNKYYGYPGWDWDFIHDSSLAGPADTLLEARARACSNYASGFITEQYGDLFVNGDSDRLPLKASVPISRSRIDKFIFYQSKAIDADAGLEKRYPGYGTRVGSIRIKLANEYMFAWFELHMSGDTARAMAFAEKADYPDSLLSLSLSWLSALPQNSILITAGDNDSYSLWWLQKVRHLRPDVTILINSLLGFPRYLSEIEQENRQRLFAVRDSLYQRAAFDYFLFGNKKEEGMETDVKDFLSDLAMGRDPYDSEAVPYKGDTIRKYYAKKLFFSLGGNKSTPSFPVGDYVLGNDYVLLDIIQTCRNRKIFFTFDYELLSALLAKKGDLYELELRETH